MLEPKSYAPLSLDPDEYRRIASWIRAQNPEVLGKWTAELVSNCTATIVRDGEHFAAIAWHHPVPQLAEGAWMFHCAVAQQYRRRWLSRRILAAIFWPPEHYGATRLYANVTSPEIRCIWQRLGFEIIQHPEHGELAYKDAQQWVE